MKLELSNKYYRKLLNKNHKFDELELYLCYLKHNKPSTPISYE